MKSYLAKTMLVLAAILLSLGCQLADEPGSQVAPHNENHKLTPDNPGSGDCDNGMKNGELRWSGCSGQQCEAGQLWELDGECACEEPSGELLRNGEQATGADGCTVFTCACNCEGGHSLETDSSGCEPRPGKDCANGLKDGDTAWDGCNDIGCDDGELWTTDADCACHTADDQRVEFRSTITLEDGCTTCTCDGWDGLSCDNSACGTGAPCENGLKDGGTFFDGCNTWTCEDGRLNTTTMACFCELENGTFLQHQESIALDDGLTVCTCVAHGQVECIREYD